jgi:predicted nucleic acid-binding protein
MTLVDTSVWVNHFRSGEPGLIRLLDDGLAGIHPFVIGELAAGNLRNRPATLADLQALPQARMATEAEVHHLLDRHRLWGMGLGWIDLHLLASALLSGWSLLTADRPLRQAAGALGVYPDQGSKGD